MDYCGVDHLVAIHVFGSVGGHIDASCTGDGTFLDIVINIDVGVELHLFFTNELCECSGLYGEDVAVANEFLSGSFAGVGQLLDLVPDAEGVIDECGDAQFVGQILADADLGGVGIQDDHVGR